VHDEVLARLLKLNQERYKAEILGGKQAEGKVKGNRRSAKGKSSTSSKMSQIPTIPGLDA
jgi:exosome complex RNA-binding protein Csl4